MGGGGDQKLRIHNPQLPISVVFITCVYIFVSTSVDIARIIKLVSGSGNLPWYGIAQQHHHKLTFNIFKTIFTDDTELFRIE
jgi:hypothetical protein